VLEGAQHTLQEHRPDLVVEYTPGDVSDEMLGMLRDLGYQPFVLAAGRHRISPLVPFTPDIAANQKADNLFCYQPDSPAHP
jgi:hypothetical protein